MINESEETSNTTMARLLEQGSRLQNTDRNFDLVEKEGKVADRQLGTLKTAHHMFNFGGNSTTKQTAEVAQTLVC